MSTYSTNRTMKILEQCAGQDVWVHCWVHHAPYFTWVKVLSMPELVDGYPVCEVYLIRYTPLQYAAPFGSKHLYDATRQSYTISLLCEKPLEIIATEDLFNDDDFDGYFYE